MIKVTDLSKNFGELKALDKVSFSVPKGSIFGLVGANGAGKSTLMRIIAGIYTADDGSVLINDEPVYDNPAAKTHLVFVPDRMHLTGSGATIERMANFYASCYPKFSFEKFNALLNIFKLDKKRRVRSLSKGMVRQVQKMPVLRLAQRKRRLRGREAAYAESYQKMRLARFMYSSSRFAQAFT